MRISKLAGMIAGLGALVAGVAVWSAEPAPKKAPPGAPPSPEALARGAIRASYSTHSLEVFGERVQQRVLRAAAKELAKGNRAPAVALEFTVRAIPFPGPVPGPIPGPGPDFPPVPGPDEIDVCWEMCAGLDCYINCAAPKPPGLAPGAATTVCRAMCKSEYDSCLASCP